jgi:hypothetical protein
MNRLFLSILCLLFLFALAIPVFASPALPVTKPPVLPVPSWTGPLQDPHAIQGQWFKDLTTSQEHAKPYEFYDNVPGSGGSNSVGSLAIKGNVQNIAYDGLGNIIGFGIQATITNDDSEIVGQWQEAQPGNLHDEWAYNRQPYMCDMRQVKLTVEFADDGIQGNLPTGGPYLPEQNIYAIDYDELGWYCWTPGNPENLQPTGDYWVPTYDFGDILHWESATRNLSFGLYAAETPGSVLFNFLQDAQLNSWDVLANRTTSLKISQYVDNFFRDTGAPYPALPHSSDVSVFFVPEPASMMMLGLGTLALYRRRKR